MKVTSIQGDGAQSRTGENVEQIRKLILEDHCLTVQELADRVGICYEVSQEILPENFDTLHIAVKFVPRFLTNDQKEECMIVLNSVQKVMRMLVSFLNL